MDRYFRAIRLFIKRHWLALLVATVLCVVPFFWMPPGTVDIGGDSTRLYFYDPFNYLKNVGLYPILPIGTGAVVPSYFLIPFVGLLWIIKLVISSPYVLASLFNSFKLAGGFLAIYGIIRRLIFQNDHNKGNIQATNVACILAGLFYIFSPAMISNYDKALITHNQVVLNPVMFYLLMRFFLDRSMIALWIALIVSVMFAPNFSYTAAPTFFSFYPLSLTYLLLYVSFMRHKSIPWKLLIIGLFIFFGLHAFHLIPEILQAYSSGNNLHTRIFDKNDVLEQIGYFLAVLPIPKLSLHFLSHAATKEFGWASVMIPLTLITGFLLSKRQKVMDLTGVFFLITFFFVTAKITDFGVTIYTKLFYIPGFSMFRNFYGQWQFVYYFFYALLFGLTLICIFSSLKKYYRFLAVAIALYLVVSASQFINGSLPNPIFNQSNNVRIAMRMDPKYDEMLAFLRTLPDDVRILTLPFTDCCYQVLHGLNNGVYIGLSTIGHLTGKNDFSGYATIAPYSDLFWKLSKEKNYESIKKLLSMLNVKYVFYNSDPLIYDDAFPDYPYSIGYVRKYMPSDQKSYPEYIKSISNGKIFEKGSYALYLIDEHYFLPRFYIPRQAVMYDMNPKDNMYNKALSFFPLDTTREIRSIFIDREACNDIFGLSTCGQTIHQFSESIPQIRFQKINPTKYKISVVNARDPYVLTFSQEYQKDWKIYLPKNNTSVKEGAVTTYFNGDIQEKEEKNIFLDSATFETLNMKSIPDASHFLVNGYANAWYITPADVGGRQEYELIVEMTGQRIFWLGTLLSVTSLVMLGIYVFKSSINSIFQKL